MNTKPEELKDGDQCTVTGGTHKGKSGTVKAINTSKTGHVTITILQKDGNRFKTVGRNVTVEKSATADKKGKLAEIKTKANAASVDDFIARVDGEQKRKDSLALIKMMEKHSKEKPKMWGASIIGFGNKRYKSSSTTREVDWFKIGFSPRKASLSVYLMLDHKSNATALKKLGKYKTDGGCIYINKLSDIDMKVLEGLAKDALKTK